MGQWQVIGLGVLFFLGILALWKGMNGGARLEMHKHVALSDHVMLDVEASFTKRRVSVPRLLQTHFEEQRSFTKPTHATGIILTMLRGEFARLGKEHARAVDDQLDDRISDEVAGIDRQLDAFNDAIALLAPCIKDGHDISKQNEVTETPSTT